MQAELALLRERKGANLRLTDNANRVQAQLAANCLQAQPNLGSCGFLERESPEDARPARER